MEREITEHVLALVRTTGDFIHQGREVQVNILPLFRLGVEVMLLLGEGFSEREDEGQFRPRVISFSPL